MAGLGSCLGLSDGGPTALLWLIYSYFSLVIKVFVKFDKFVRSFHLCIHMFIHFNYINTEIGHRLSDILLSIIGIQHIVYLCVAFVGYYPLHWGTVPHSALKVEKIRKPASARHEAHKPSWKFHSTWLNLNLGYKHRYLSLKNQGEICFGS